VLLGHWGVLDQLEPEHADVEGERFVVVADDERELSEVLGHGSLRWSGESDVHAPSESSGSPAASPSRRCAKLAVP
jgi:hypothetical protein